MSSVRSLIAGDPSNVTHFATAVRSHAPGIEAAGRAPEAAFARKMIKKLGEVGAVLRHLPLEAIGLELVRHCRARH
jgi:hypothetical protein